uniref:BZIP domain-containing protein n=1 Tax=Panagrellus redivivus TaxID=6233 RepID=A0A7E4VCZ7_PANRE
MSASISPTRSVSNSRYTDLDEAAQRERREKNNQAVKKCRAARRQQEQQTLEEVRRMRELHRKLKKEFEDIKNEVDLLQELITLCNKAKP